MTNQSPKQDIYSRVTARILAELEKGVRPWIKLWSVEHAAGRIIRPLRHNGIPYRGVNVLLLWGESLEKGYAAPLWMTYKQSQELGAQVRKGEHGSLVVFADRFTKTDTNDQGEAVEHAIPFMKGYTVFNVDQIEGLPAHFYAHPVNPLPLSERIEHADSFVTATRQQQNSSALKGSSNSRPCRTSTASTARLWRKFKSRNMTSSLTISYRSF